MSWQESIRSLWIERLIWVRQLILGILLDLHAVSYIERRISRNSSEFGQILGSIYGSEAGKRFEELLSQYINTLIEIVSTLKAGHDVQYLLQQWDNIAVEIANFLSQINPYWAYDTIYSLVKSQANRELEYARMLQERRYVEAIANYDKSFYDALYSGNLMVYGIESQFGVLAPTPQPQENIQASVATSSSIIYYTGR